MFNQEYLDFANSLPDDDPIKEYLVDVFSGKTLVCQAVYLSLVRHVTDVKKSETSDFRYYYNYETAKFAIDFMETFGSISKGRVSTLKFTPWQKFVQASIFGWLDKETDFRRFREALQMTARKQGKSLVSSAMATKMLVADNENGPEVYCLSNTQKQARIIFEEARNMIMSNKHLSKYMRTLRDTVYCDINNGKFEPRSSDSSSLDGLNVSFAVLDELHEFTDWLLYNVIKNATMSREQPLIFIATTAGFVLDGPLVELYEMGQRVLRGEQEADKFFFYIAELDSEDEIDKPEMWIKANPNMGVSIKLSEMIEDWEQDKLITGRKVDFITKRLGMFVDYNDKTFIDYESLNSSVGTYEDSFLLGKDVVIGIDMSVSGDLSSVVYAFDIDDKLYVKHQTFITRAKLTERNNDKYDYRVALEENDVIIAGESTIDKMIVYDHIMREAKKYNIISINYDPAYAQELIAKLRASYPCLEIRQGHRTLSEPMLELRNALIRGEVNFNNSNLFRWFLGNVECRYDVNGNVAPDKKNAYKGNKIDGFSAWLNAHVTLYERRITGLNQKTSLTKRILKF